ncbi:MAG: MarR family winged helix-turn-helix transcriptional regulator [Pyrinomonadaceae bacterium]|nr:MarR family winged helix-turn-helix transcriptional regulator [Pyrinomonadaceae bacterium]
MIDFEKSVTYVLTQLAIGYRTYLEKALGEIGLHSGQVFVMISLWKTDGQSQIDLVKNLDLTAPTVNIMIKSLMNGGFVECRKCPSDGRLMRVFLTDKGIECQTSVAEQWTKIEAQSYLNLTETEKLVLAQLFGKLRENLSLNIKTGSTKL